ncbi:hypothetical protein [Piscinibacter gummiphilus]|uniref:Nitrogenase-stabilizing/protective protein NifW n=1 Tax=Piscinibacter gummiphilus TaxID=946333 RepID=A0ABZ0CVC5_9BURK|nr:hypothetical protein [Piscinibacter gummiphilus]WOB06897.1 hypothetical protein RXV79_18465 [Piscinibacter gummiphilus]
MSNGINVNLSEDEALVLFEFFARFDETNLFRMRNNAEFVAFMRISGQLEKALVAPFEPAYQERIEEARARLTEGHYELAPGVEPDASNEKRA